MQNKDAKLIKCETHMHIKNGSPCAKVSAQDAARMYREEGYGAVVLTNHYMRYLSENYYPLNPDKSAAEYFIELYDEVKPHFERQQIRTFFAMELTPHRPELEGGVDLLLYGITPDFLRQYPDLYDYQDNKLYELLKENDILCYQAHPFRSYCRLHDIKYLDGIEVFNGHPWHDAQNHRAEQLAKQHNLLQISGSDFHDAMEAGAPRTITGGIWLDPGITTEQQLARYLATLPPLIKNP